MKQTILFTIAFGIVIAIFTGMADSERLAYTSSVLSLPDTTMELSFLIYDGRSETEPVLRETRRIEVRDSRIDLDFEPGLLPPGEDYFIDILSGDEIIASREPLMRPEEPMAVGLEVGMSGEDLYIAADAVGIGTTTPAVKLDVEGGIASYQSGGSFIYLNPGASGSTINYSGSLDINETSGYPGGLGTANRLLIDGFGNVGIGSSSPAYKLDVDGTARVTGFIMPTGAGSNRVLTSNATGTATWQDLPSIPSDNVTGSGTATRVAFWNGANTVTSNANLYWDNTNSRLGIGTASPEGRLAVRQDMTNISTSFTYPHLKLMASNTVDNTGFVGITFAGSTSENYGWSTGALRSTSGQSDFVWKHHSNDALGTEYMRILSTGNVGIGTSSPSTQLHTTGGVRFAGIGGSGSHLTIDGSGNITRTTISGTVSGSGTNNYISRWTPDGTTLGNSSIWNDGTYVRVIQSSASPVGARFYVQGAPVTTSGSEFLAHIRLAGGSNHYGVLRLEDGGAANALGPVLEVQKYGTGPSATFTGGNVGIGTTAPLVMLDVRGNSAFGTGIVPTSTETENIINILSGSSSDGASNGIAFMENTSGFGMKLGYDGTGAGAANKLAIYSDTDTEIISFQNGGNVGLGVATPAAQLHTSGTVRFAGIGGSGAHLTIDGSGNITRTTISSGTSQWEDAGVYKRVIGNDNVRAYEASQDYGLYGRTTAGGTDNYGVYGEATGSTNDYAIYGYASGGVSGDWGVYGYNGFQTGFLGGQIIGLAGNWAGVYGDAYGSSSQRGTLGDSRGYGVWGSQGSGSYAGYFNGDVAITGGLQANGIGGSGSHLTIDGSGNITRTTISGGISGSGSDNYLARWNGSGALQNSAVYVTDGGDVGIGTSSPNYQLHVEENSTGSTDITVSNTNSSGDMGFRFSQTTGLQYAGLVLYGHQEMRLYNNNTGGYFTFSNSAGSERMRITSAGYVGIGTSAPSTQLHTTGGVRFAGIAGSGSHLTIDGSGNITRTTISGGISGSGSANSVARWTGASSIGTGTLYDNGTNVGINISTPQYRTDIVGGTTSGTVLRLRTNGTGSGQETILRFTNTTNNDATDGYSSYIAGIRISGSGDQALAFGTSSTSTAPTERMRLDQNGNLGIGTTTPLSPLDVRSSGGIRVTNPSSTSNYMQMETPGTWHRIYTTNNLTIQSGGSITLTPASNLTFSGLSGTGNHLYIDGSGNITRTTISGGTSLWNDNTTYISPSTCTETFNIYDDFNTDNGQILYAYGYDYSNDNVAAIRGSINGGSLSYGSHSGVMGESYNWSSSYYGLDYTNRGVAGYTSYGGAYTFGVAGYRYDRAGGPSAGVFGAVSEVQNPSAWGALGFQDASSNEYAGYFNGNVRVTGRFYDSSGNSGTAGQVLSSTGTGTQWVDGGGSSGDPVVFITEICHWRTATTGAPGSWPSYMLADDYIEITGPANADISGYTLEMWTTSAITGSWTLASGTVLSPSGTCIIATGQLGSSSPSPANYYYHSGGTQTMSSTTSQGYIIKDSGGDIVDAVGYPGSSTSYTFPSGAGVSASDWSGGSISSASSTAGTRLIGPDANSFTNWVVSSSTYTQDPNVRNSGVGSRRPSFAHSDATDVPSHVSNVQTFGTSELRNGFAVISLDTDFSRNIGSAIPTVVATPLEDCNGLVISERTSSSFTVSESGGGRSNISFSWIAIARPDFSSVSPELDEEFIREELERERRLEMESRNINDE